MGHLPQNIIYFKNCIFGVSVVFWRVLGVLVSYEIIIGVTLVVRRVSERVYKGFRGVLGGLGGVNSGLGGSA